MIDRRGTDWENDPERQRQCDEYEEKTKWRWEFGAQTLRTLWPIYQIVPSHNPEDRWIKKEWVIETHRALEWHYTWIYKDPSTGKTMLLWQWDEDGWLIVEYDSNDHWGLCDRYMFFRMTSELPPRYNDPTHPLYLNSKKTRNNISQHIFSILDMIEDDFMKQFQINR